jgi:hypothetical protein
MVTKLKREVFNTLSRLLSKCPWRSDEEIVSPFEKVSSRRITFSFVTILPEILISETVKRVSLSARQSGKKIIRKMKKLI